MVSVVGMSMCGERDLHWCLCSNRVTVLPIRQMSTFLNSSFKDACVQLVVMARVVNFERNKCFFLSNSGLKPKRQPTLSFIVASLYTIVFDFRCGRYVDAIT